MADNLFSQLDKIGLGMLRNIDLYETDVKPANKNVPEETAEKQVMETDFLFDKGFKCPVCDADFKVKAVKTGKAKLLGIDSDLRPKYQGVDALKYDCIACPKCGYAALSRFFNYITNVQAKAIQANISAAFREDNERNEVYSYDDAVMKHQLALANAVVKKSKPSEKAYICLKLAWLMRGKAENLPADTDDREQVLKETKIQEQQYIENAYRGFLSAMSKEVFPICGMDEWTYVYLVADLARQCEDYTTCAKLVSDIIVSKEASSKLKEKARDLRKSIKEKI